MMLYEVPDHSRIRLLEDAQVPPAARLLKKGDVLKFSRIDGMYSTCFMDGERVYPGASTKVEIL